MLEVVLHYLVDHAAPAGGGGGGGGRSKAVVEVLVVEVLVMKVVAVKVVVVVVEMLTEVEMDVSVLVGKAYLKVGMSAWVKEILARLGVGGTGGRWQVVGDR